MELAFYERKELPTRGVAGEKNPWDEPQPQTCWLVYYLFPSPVIFSLSYPSTSFLFFVFSLFPFYSLLWVMFSSIGFPLSHSWHIDILPDPVLSLFGLIGIALN